MSELPSESVRRTVGGHIFEEINTVGRERLKTTHSSGTSHEFDARGGETVIIQGRGYRMVIQDDDVVVQGDCNLTVMGNCTTNVLRNHDLTVQGNQTVTVMGNRKTIIGGKDTLDVHGDRGVIVHGDDKLKVDGNISVNIEKDSDFKLMGKLDLTVNKSAKAMINEDFFTIVGKRMKTNVGETLAFGAKDIIIVGKTQLDLGASTINVGADSIASNVNIDASSAVTISGADTTINKNLQVDDAIVATNEVTGNGIELSTHTHDTPQPEHVIGTVQTEGPN